jgi:hypothetical protein
LPVEAPQHGVSARTFPQLQALGSRFRGNDKLFCGSCPLPHAARGGGKSKTKNRKQIPMLNLVQSLGLDTLARAQALKLLRWLATFAGAALTGWLLAHGVSEADTALIVTSVGGIILGVGSALVSLAFSFLDGRKVDAKLKTKEAVTAEAVASAVQTRPEIAPVIAAQAAAALAEREEASKQLAQTIAALRAGAT